MNQKRNHKYGKQLQAIEQKINPSQSKLSFTCNYILLLTSTLILCELYWSFHHRKVSYFVYTSIAADLAFPFLLKIREQKASLKVILLQGTLIPSVMYSCWIIAYPQKTYLYFMPLFLSMLSKVCQQLGYFGQQQLTDMADNLVKFQTKIQILVLLYTIFCSIFRFRYTWPKLLKVVLLIGINKYKYFTHFGSQAAWREIHLTLDNLSKIINCRRYYQQFYSKFCWFGNRANDHKAVLL